MLTNNPHHESTDDENTDDYDHNNYDTIQDRVSALISNALGSNFEDNFSFYEEDEEDQDSTYLQEAPSRPTAAEKMRQVRNNKQKQSRKPQYLNRNEEMTGEVFQVGNLTVNEAKARLLGLSINDLKKKFNKKDDENTILPEPKSEHFANLQKNKKFRSAKKEDLFSKEDERKNCTFKPKPKTPAQIAAAKAAGFNIGGSGGNNDGDIGGGGFRLKEVTDRDRELEREKAFCRRQDAFINAKKKDLERAMGEDNYDYVLDSDKKRCPNCGNLQSYEEILKKEKRCRGENCNGAAYVRGVTFHSTSFLKRQEEYQRKSEAQLKQLEASTLEEQMKLSQQLKSTNTAPIIKMTSNASGATAATMATMANDPQHNVPKDLKQPRYLSQKSVAPSGIIKSISNADLQDTKLNGTTANARSRTKQVVSQSTLSAKEVECEQQMLQHLETIVGKSSGSQQANKFVADTYNKMMQSSTLPKGMKPTQVPVNSVNRAGRKTKPKSNPTSQVPKEVPKEAKTSSEVKKKSTSPRSPPPHFTVPTLHRQSSLEQPIGKVKSGPLELDPWNNLLY